MDISSNSLLLVDHPEIYGKKIAKFVTLISSLVILSLPLMELFTGYLRVNYNFRVDWSIPVGVFFILLAIWRIEREATFSNALFLHNELDLYLLFFVLLIYYFVLTYNLELFTTFHGFLISFGLLFLICTARNKIFAIYDDGIYIGNSFKTWSQIKNYYWSDDDNKKIIFPSSGLFFHSEFTLTKQEKELIQPFLNKHLEDFYSKEERFSINKKQDCQEI